MASLLSRRVFLAAGSAAFAGLLAGCGGGGSIDELEVPAAGGPSRPAPTGADAVLASLAYADFDHRMGPGWELTSAEGERAPLELTEVVDRSHENPYATAMGFRAPFSATFEGPADRCCAEGRYDLTHPELGTVTVFAAYGGTVERETVMRTTVKTNVYALHFD
ncbi:MAG: hypothetical protein QNJ98_10120 [Planctomycetota bacterium]|nr:hypothetical protein [Planctomycetota bacterium]